MKNVFISIHGINFKLYLMPHGKSCIGVLFNRILISMKLTILQFTDPPVFGINLFLINKINNFSWKITVNCQNGKYLHDLALNKHKTFEKFDKVPKLLVVH